MDAALIATRGVHFAASIGLAGDFAFALLVVRPSYGMSGGAVPPLLRARLAWLASACLALALVSAPPWLAAVARTMSGEAPSLTIAAKVATATQFGRVWILRVGLLAVLVPCVAGLGKRRSAEIIGAILGAVQLAALAAAGHSGAEAGWSEITRGGADALHLVAAGGWVGTLPPLVLLLAATRRAGDRQAVLVAREALVRFSGLGMTCVAALVVTGTINAWYLLGSVAALIGTRYGQLLLAKLALFAAMAALAVVNRFVLLPRLATSDHGRKAVESRTAAAQIGRYAAAEAALGLGVIAIVAVLGTLVPGAHEQAWWPFPVRFGLDTIAAAPELRNDAVGTAVLALAGLVLLGLGWYRRAWLAIATGLVLFLGLGWRPIELLLVDATPTSYYASPEPFAVPAIIKGREVYARNCVSCHGAEGRGDGPLARASRIAPADLTAPHFFLHTDGDLFWFVTSGMDDGVMPGFASTLDGTERWDVIAFMKARAFGAEAATMTAAVEAGPALPAPDFAFAAAEGEPGTVHDLLARGGLLLAFFAGASPRGVQLASWRDALAESGVSVLVLQDAADVRAVYALYDRDAPADAPVEFLIDRHGFLRARWHPGEEPDWGDLDRLAREIAAMPQGELAAPAQPAEHIHSN